MQAKQEQMYCSVTIIITADKPTQFVIAAWKKISISWIKYTSSVWQFRRPSGPNRARRNMSVFSMVQGKSQREASLCSLQYQEGYPTLFPSLLRAKWGISIWMDTKRFKQKQQVWPWSICARDAVSSFTWVQHYLKLSINHLPSIWKRSLREKKKKKISQESGDAFLYL